MAEHLDKTLGAALVGLVVAALLHGVSCVQAFYYFTLQNDRWPIMLLVSAVIFSDTVHQALITHAVYTYTISDWGHPDTLSNVVWSLPSQVIINGITTLLVQGFFTLRVWRLSHKRMVLTSVIALLVIGEFVSIVIYTAKAFRAHTWVKIGDLKGISITVNVLAAAADILLAVTLCTILHLSRTSFQRSDNMITKLIVFTVNTGLLTSLCALASLISIVVAGRTYIYIAFFFSVGRLYTNSLFATLNARKLIKMGGSGMGTNTENLTMSFRELPVGGIMTTASPSGISIRIDTTQECATDPDQKVTLEKSGIKTRNSSNTPFNVVEK